jgi:hypothetical protein
MLAAGLCAEVMRGLLVLSSAPSALAQEGCCVFILAACALIVG